MAVVLRKRGVSEQRGLPALLFIPAELVQAGFEGGGCVVRGGLQLLDRIDFQLLLRDEEKVKVTARLPKVLEAPVAEGEQVGEVVYTLEGEEIASYPVYTGERVEKIDFSWCLEQVADRYELMQER